MRRMPDRTQLGDLGLQDRDRGEIERAGQTHPRGAPVARYLTTQLVGVRRRER